MPEPSPDAVEFVDEQDEAVETDLAPELISRAVIYSTDWTTETIISQLQRGNIDFRPRFQRRDAWSIPRKSRFIESLILGLPIPQIVLAEKTEDRGRFIVLDGKQRLLTLLQFTGVAEGRNNAFALTSLDIRKDLIGRSYADILDTPDLERDRHQFANQPIRSMVIRNWPNLDFLHLVFVRLNTGSVSLSPQELRQAAFPGPFVDFADDASSESRALRTLLKIDEPDFRMRDVELLVRYIAFQFFLSQYAGNMKAFLDHVCEELNRQWVEKQEEISRRVGQFEEAMGAAVRIFGEDHVGRRWMGEAFEPRLNRAVLDVIAFYFSDRIIRNAALRRRAAVANAFKDLCVEDEAFRTSVETTTKSLTATATRFNLWGTRLRRVLRLRFNVPGLRERRIHFASFR